jgi:hypothetical protein
MEGEEIVIIEEGVDSPIGTEYYCCFLIYAPFRG